MGRKSFQDNENEASPSNPNLTIRFKLPSVPNCLNSFFTIGIIFQSIILILFGLFTTYPTYQPADIDVKVLFFVGFSVLFCLLSRSGWAGITWAILVGAMTFEWSIVCNVFYWLIRIGWYDGINGIKLHSIVVDNHFFVVAVYCSISVWIATAGVLGRTSLEQLIVMMFFMVPAYFLNYWLVAYKIGAIDTGGTIFIHAFGAFFGFAVSWVLGHDVNHRMKRRFKDPPFFELFCLFLLCAKFLRCFQG